MTDDKILELIDLVHNRLEKNRDRGYGNSKEVRAAQYEATGRIVAAIIMAKLQKRELEL